MQRTGKHVLLACGMAFLCALAGCGRTYGMLSTQNAGNAYMQDYFDTPGQALAQGTHFEAKGLAYYVLHGTDRRAYMYRIIVAPRTERPLSNIMVYFTLNTEVQDYFAQCAHVDNFGMGADTWTTPYDAPTAFAPVEYTLMWSNGGDAFQQQHGISHAQLETAMRYLTVTVEADGIPTDTFTLSLPPAVHVDSADDPRIQDDADIKAFFVHGVRSCTRKIYGHGEEENPLQQ